MIKILLAAIKKAITRKWHKEDPLTNQWNDIVEEIFGMERLTYTLRIQQSEFAEKWTKWIEYKSQRRGTTKTLDWAQYICLAL